MRASKGGSVDHGRVVADLEQGCPVALEAASSFGARTWFSWRAPGAGSAAKRQLLHLAAAKGLPRAASELLRLGADPSAAGDDGATPMHCACHGGGEALAAVLQILLGAGATRETRDVLGRRPVDILLAQVGGRADPLGCSREILPSRAGAAPAGERGPRGRRPARSALDRAACALHSTPS